MNRTAYQVIIDRLHRLTVPQLQDVQRRIVALLDTAESAPESAEPGHIEEKMINGCGPYRYLRVWRNGRLTSRYLGKKPLE
ncbi:MAG: hypothetical protein M0Z43_02965 [Acidithiobacillus sp.]|nr:hypothetical protein [Acidithiobacillus sp.]